MDSALPKNWLRPENVNLSSEVLSRLLDNWPVARLATMATPQQPHLVPIVFCELNGDIYSPVDGKRKNGRQLQRLRNLREISQITLLLDHYSADWQSLWWVRIDASGEVFDPDQSNGASGAAIADRLMKKYPQYADPSLMFDPSRFLRLVPTEVTAWSQSGSDTVIDTAVSELLRD